MAPSSDIVTARAERPPHDGRGLCLVVVTDQAVQTHELPAAGEVVIGRSSDCDVAIDDASVSRRHAALHLGPAMTIEDLGSANGTTLHDRAVASGAPQPLRCGETVLIGLVTVVVQPRARAASVVHDHTYFAARLGEACRQWVPGTPVAVAMLRFANPPSSAAIDALAAAPVVATYAPHTYELLVTAADPEAQVQALRASLAGMGCEVISGVARCGVDGRDAEALIAAAAAASRGPDRYRLGDLTVVVRSPTMARIYRLTERIAASDLSVLVLGETGVGKEVLAEAIHRMSPRSARPFLRLNCAALSETLLESELFGHERGAFTGADRAKVGLLESAQGGTVFLDEIGELSAAAQVKLLRTLEERHVLPVGAVRPRPIDLRFVAATNRDLELEAAGGRFRADLYFRLNGFSLVVPPLRERVDEIAALAELFMTRAAVAAGRPVPGLTAEARRWLEAHPWPGNIRELRNVVERAVVLSSGEPIGVEHFGVDGAHRWPRVGAPAALPQAPTSPALGADPAAIRDALAAAERARVLAVLEASAGNQTQAAKQLGMSRRTLLKRLDAYAVARPRKPRR